MNPEIKAKWVTALRSGDYAQGRLRLCRGSKYCCLGVLVEELHGEDAWTEDDDGDLLYDGCATSIPSEDMQRAGLDRMAVSKLMDLNDRERKSFSEIADRRLHRGKPLIVTLKKLSGGESLRTDSITGILIGGRWPEVGEGVFIINADPLGRENGENMRQFNTSRVKAISPDGPKRTITTETGSVYLMEEVNDPEE